MKIEMQLALLDEFNDFLTQIGGGRQKNPCTDLKKFLVKHFNVSEADIAEVCKFLEPKQKTVTCEMNAEQVGKLDSFLYLLHLRPRNFDSKNADLKKLKMLVANKKVRLRKELDGSEEE